MSVVPITGGASHPIAMNPLRHLLHLQNAATRRESETVRVVTPFELHRRSGALFRAPALPTLQFCNEMPFTVRFGPRIRERM